MQAGACYHLVSSSQSCGRVCPLLIAKGRTECIQGVHLNPDGHVPFAQALWPHFSDLSSCHSLTDLKARGREHKLLESGAKCTHREHCAGNSQCSFILILSTPLGPEHTRAPNSVLWISDLGLVAFKENS